MSSSAAIVESDTTPPAPTARTTTPVPVFIPSTVTLTTTSVPHLIRTTPATIPPIIATSPSTMFAPSEGASTGDGGSSRRFRIYVLSDRFVPHGYAIYKFITDKMKERQYKEGYTWSKIDKHTHDFYWREFKKHYYWPIEEENAIKAIWEKVYRGYYSRNLCRWHNSYKKTGKKPVWIENEIWNKWLEHWNTEEFKHKSKQASINRCSETGGNGGGVSRHLGGSKSFVEHAMDLSKTLQRTHIAFDIFYKTHVNKEGKGVDSRAHDAMQKMVETASQTLSDGSQSSPLDMDAIYLEAFGGEKKKRVYGLGSHALSLYQESLCSGATSASPPPSASMVFPEIVSKLEGTKKKMTYLEKQNQSLLQQNQKMMR
ncbi:uncharacterized protein LOC120273240 [Dioscorea cayenensis subsp. rotundata]|uniref:Uncharacterized protein LOC120273240 n=1 Tax=Dioscorea cayennensis subsp. rotundata TaxID=55577 RepID=A0AB40C7K6_DIOCR|nr:uncharacterized protein LOC120273240 [Dioscorea cayenensis subsp. rotundata]